MNVEYQFLQRRARRSCSPSATSGTTTTTSQNFSSRRTSGRRSGVELRIFLPIFQAPLRFIYAFNLNPSSSRSTSSASRIDQPARRRSPGSLSRSAGRSKPRSTRGGTGAAVPRAAVLREAVGRRGDSSCPEWRLFSACCPTAVFATLPRFRGEGVRNETLCLAVAAAVARGRAPSAQGTAAPATAAPASRPGGSLQIGVINVERLVQESALGKEAFNRVKKLNDSEEGRRRQAPEGAPRHGAEAGRSGRVAGGRQAGVAPEDATRRRRSPSSASRTTRTATSRRRRRRSSASSSGACSRSSTRSARSSGFTLIFNKFQSGLVYADEAVDITDDVLKRSTRPWPCRPPKPRPDGTPRKPRRARQVRAGGRLPRRSRKLRRGEKTRRRGAAQRVRDEGTPAGRGVPARVPAGASRSTTWRAPSADASTATAGHAPDGRRAPRVAPGPRISPGSPTSGGRGDGRGEPRGGAARRRREPRLADGRPCVVVASRRSRSAVWLERPAPAGPGPPRRRPRRPRRPHRPPRRRASRSRPARRWRPARGSAPGPCSRAGAYVGEDAQIGEDCVLGPERGGPRGLPGRRSLRPPARAPSSARTGSATSGTAGRTARSRRSGSSASRTTSRSAPTPTIDRATLGETVIGRGTKIDNLVQVGHNVVVGEHSILCGQAGVGGLVAARAAA